MSIIECMNTFMLYVMSYTSQKSIEYYDNNMTFFCNYLLNRHISLDSDINILSKNDYVGYIAYHKGRGIKNTSVRTYARAVKVFLRYCYNEGYLLENITLNVKYPKSDKKIIVPLSQQRVNMLDDYIYHGYMYPRNMCIFHLMLDCGLRLGEVIRLNVSDVNFDDKYIIVRYSKNNKSRVVPLPDSVAYMLHNYIKHYKHPQTGALILNASYDDRITVCGIEKVFSRIKSCDSDIYPHLLRHTFGTSFILGGGSLEILRVLMGHEDYNVTKEYLHIATQSQIVNLDIYKLDDVFFRTYNYNK